MVWSSRTSGRPRAAGRGRNVEPMSADPGSAKAALERIVIPSAHAIACLIGARLSRVDIPPG
jgi:hypothetical protein